MLYNGSMVVRKLTPLGRSTLKIGFTSSLFVGGFLALFWFGLVLADFAAGSPLDFRIGIMFSLALVSPWLFVSLIGGLVRERVGVVAGIVGVALLAVPFLIPLSPITRLASLTQSITPGTPEASVRKLLNDFDGPYLLASEDRGGEYSWSYWLPEGVGSPSDDGAGWITFSKGKVVSTEFAPD